MYVSRQWSFLLGLLLLVLVLSVAGCSRTNTISEAFYPCGPAMGDGEDYHDQFLAWTPDGEHLILHHAPVGSSGPYYYMGKAIWAVDNNGTRLRMIVDTNPGYGARFGFHADVPSESTHIVFSTCEFLTKSAPSYPGIDTVRSKYHYEIAVINLDGTGKQRLTENAYLDHYPAWSPDGNHIAFIANPKNPLGGRQEDKAELYVMAADGSDVKLVASTLNKVIRENGREIWLTNAEVSRGKELREEEIEHSKSTWLGAVVLAPPVWSPDGDRLAFLVYEGKYWPFRKILFTVRVDGSELTRIAEIAQIPVRSRHNTWAATLPVWSPEGERLAFVMAGVEGKTGGVYTVRPDGTDLVQVLEPQGVEWDVSQVLWSPDGLEILVISWHQLFLVQPDGNGLRALKLSEPVSALRIAAWSPDGARIAFYEPADGYRSVPPQLYTVARDGTDLRSLVTADADGNLVPANSPQQTD